MGLFDFVKEAGEDLIEKLGQGSEKDTQTVSNRVQEMGLSLDDLKVEVDGDKAVIRGKAASQADAEKAVLELGNTPGIASVDDQLEVATPAAQSQYHKVVSGDTLSKIAKEFYGDAMKYPVIFEANQPMLEDPDKIYPGQVLRIPPLED